ncbi:aminotransferase class V-fold PLP-dependent enzyme [uncultured Neglectibacter sp.]|uniref:aminotransferase class V-fold PLP-dependent enzyme n=1 Tax=uncultured Neglectibacter sp. TaxID=1924108 RepID=UPI0034DFA5EA
MIYLDNSATTYPKPPQVREALLRAVRDFGANPGRSGYEMSMRTTRAVYECRRCAAELFGAAGPECVVFQPSCTQALNLVLKGSLKSGDHVVVSDLEHNAVMRPLVELKNRGVTYTVAKVTPADSDATTDAFRQAMNANTKLVVCTQASNVFGIRVPVERIAALCHQYGAKICVDCAQSAGILPISLADSGIDYLCCAGHKGLYGPMGTGMLIFRDPQDKLGTLIEGGTGTQSRSMLQPDDPPERYESGTLNVPGILALRAGMEFVKKKRPEVIWQEEMRKTALLYDRLSKIPGVKLYTEMPRQPWYVPVLSFTVEGMPSEAVGEQLAKAGVAVRCGLHCAPLAHEKMGTLETGTVRVSPSVFTRKEEMDALTMRVKAICRNTAPGKKNVKTS